MLATAGHNALAKGGAPWKAGHPSPPGRESVYIEWIGRRRSDRPVLNFARDEQAVLEIGRRTTSSSFLGARKTIIRRRLRGRDFLRIRRAAL